jgi:hypothetical protein
VRTARDGITLADVFEQVILGALADRLSRAVKVFAQ